MPAVIPILAVTGASAAIGGAAAAAIGLGTVGAVAATAIGTGIVAGGMTALEGGDVGDVLESAIVGGATTYVGGSIGEFLGGASDVVGGEITSGVPSWDETGGLLGGDLASSTSGYYDEITGSFIPDASGVLQGPLVDTSNTAGYYNEITGDFVPDASGPLQNPLVDTSNTSGYYNEITGDFVPDANGPLQNPLTEASGTNYESMDGYFYDKTTDTWLTPSGESISVNAQGEAINADGTKNLNIKASDALRLAALAAGGAGAANLADSFGGKFDIVPIPSDWTSPPPTSVAAFTPLAPIDFGNQEMLRGTQWEQLLSPTYNQPAPTPAVPTNPSNMSFEELTKILGGSRTSVPTQNVTINDVIAGIQSQYGQTPQGSMG